MSISIRIVLLFTLMFLLLSVTAYPVAAHGGGSSGDLWRQWAWQDLPLLLLMGGVYALGLQALWKRAGTGKSIHHWHVAAFGMGWIILFIALVSPLDALSEELFSAHMVQHLLMVLVAAPLFTLGRFSLAVTWAFPARWTAKVWKEWKWGRVWVFLMRPMTVFLFHNAVIWLWHMPRLYEASVRNEWIHFLEHFSFFLTAFLFWQVFVDLTESLRMGRSAKFGSGIFMIFGTMLVSGFLGVLIAFSPHVWYSVYAHETAHYGLTALEDQQLAGTIMWVPSGVVYLVAVIGVMGRWLFAMESLENPQI
jgi:putative membrane protein